MPLSEGEITASLLLTCFVLQGTKLRGKEQDKLKPPFCRMWQGTPTTSVFREWRQELLKASFRHTVSWRPA